MTVEAALLAWIGNRGRRRLIRLNFGLVLLLVTTLVWSSCRCC